MKDLLDNTDEKDQEVSQIIITETLHRDKFTFTLIIDKPTDMLNRV